MSLWIAAIWGLVGSAVSEALNLYAMMRPTTESKGRWQWPWRDKRDRPIVLFAVALRSLAGTGLAAAAWAGGLATTAFATFTFGVAAPLVIAKIFDQIRVLDQPSREDVQSGGSDDDAA
ncbi:hypothetical protein BDK92_6466 [Micromonospora pisi]|uniref:Uncharacterized protein n=1 Tax=Micromonospora pisi TaxID=589240 RepID=A0A495JUJ8_9ACTN|nr:hypothetical protein [Micromonospora pisi]RKR92034.1 hypothetical protein BDK92_6466 [Micromonospora pisi]